MMPSFFFRSKILPAGFLLLFSTRPIAAADATYASLRAAAPAGGGVAVENLTVERDVFTFHFDSGTFYFLAPVAERAPGAVFVGRGSYDLKPVAASEARHLELVAHEKGLQALHDQFDSLVLLFTDGTEKEIRQKGLRQTDPFDARATAAWERFGRHQRKDFRTNFDIPVLEDLLQTAPGGPGLFLAFVDGQKFPPALAAVDPKGIERLGLSADLGDEGSAFYVADKDRGGFWYLDRMKSATGDRRPFAPPARAIKYTIDFEIQKNASIRGVTTIEFSPVEGNLRVVPLALMGKLRIEDVSYSPAASSPPEWTPASFVQENMDEDADAAVVFPKALGAGQKYLLRVSDAGREVLRDAGDGNYYVRARESWYPNLGSFGEASTFDITYRVPKDRQIVSVGDMAAERLEGETRISTWRTKIPVRVAGFNYGKFKKLDAKDKESGFQLSVYTNPGTPDIINEINQALKSLDTYDNSSAAGGSPYSSDELNNPFASVPRYAGNRSLSIDTEQLAQSALADGVNAARVFSAYFGGLSDPHAAITQQSQWDFGQSWPSLIYLPYQAFIDAGTRHEIGMTRADSDFIDKVGYHEFAHQWWGHRVGAASYRDLWLVEGFAEFSASLVIERVEGPQKANAFWEKTRKLIVESTRPGAVSNVDAGPITLGSRLFTDRTPVAYQALVYAKGAYVIQMLRMLMRDVSGPKPDANFIAMMSDYAATYAGRNPTTADFQKIVERHLVPALNGTRDGKLDWFFNQWVGGTAIPKYASKLDVKEEGGGHYRIVGSISQEAVPEGFRGLVPVYLDFGKGKMARIGIVTIIGATNFPIDVKVNLPQKPKSVSINALHDVLSR